MVFHLTKGQSASLTRDNIRLSKILVGLGWDVSDYDGQAEFDLDASAFLVGANGKIARPGDIVFYDNLKHYSGSVQHMGDNLTGGSGGDDEQIKIDLDRLPVGVKKIVITVTIYQAEERKQNFGQVRNAFVRIFDEESGLELMRYDLENGFADYSAVVVCEICREGGFWYFKAVGSGRS